MNETFISSDCGDIGQLKTAFSLANDDAEAAAVALNAGVDQDLCVSTYPQGLPAALKQGLISTATLDASVGNILHGAPSL
jgi:beta-glucosidase